ncbi:ashwin-like [Gracilinanus agilis]|uniref:ashwin-like n=1 Tax=Gracilinanus agilis TaxID=191870 RepID=UPI001CFE9225|nr:ashwin-like [Gracilinanus agilis]XP_044538561.1 ashwin-like [Gracilinanus agilis]
MSSEPGTSESQVNEASQPSLPENETVELGEASQDPPEVTKEGSAGDQPYVDTYMLLHPELLSREFLLLTLQEKNIIVKEEIKTSKNDLIALYNRYALPLPQREAPESRWGKAIEEKRELQNEVKNEPKSDVSAGPSRKRARIVFDGNSTSTCIKVRRTEKGANDGLKPPPSVGLPSNTIRKLPNSNASTVPTGLKANPSNDTNQSPVLTNNSKSAVANVKAQPLSRAEEATVVKLKRIVPREDAKSANEFKSLGTKKKIQRITWP